MILRNRKSRRPLFSILLWLYAAPETYSQSAIVPQATIPGGGYRIAGTVVSKADGHPLARARVLISNVKDQKSVQSMVTSDDGKFEFSGLPAAKFSLTGVKRGFINSAYEQHGQFSTAIDREPRGRGARACGRGCVRPGRPLLINGCLAATDLRIEP